MGVNYFQILLFDQLMSRYLLCLKADMQCANKHCIVLLGSTSRYKQSHNIPARGVSIEYSAQGVSSLELLQLQLSQLQLVWGGVQCCRVRVGCRQVGAFRFPVAQCHQQPGIPGLAWQTVPPVAGSLAVGRPRLHRLPLIRVVRLWVGVVNFQARQCGY